MSWEGEGAGVVRVERTALERFLAAEGYPDLQAFLDAAGGLEAELDREGGLLALTLPAGPHAGDQPESFLEALRPYAQVGSTFVETGEYCERTSIRHRLVEEDTGRRWAAEESEPVYGAPARRVGEALRQIEAAIMGLGAHAPARAAAVEAHNALAALCAENGWTVAPADGWEASNAAPRRPPRSAP
jgi:hypothetical protein